MNRSLLFSSVLLIFCTVFFSAQKSYNTLVFEGNKEFDKKNYESSSSKYMEAIKINENDFGAHYNLGNSLYKRKMFAEATAEYEKAEKLATTIPDKAAALYNLAPVDASRLVASTLPLLVFRSCRKFLVCAPPILVPCRLRSGV